VKRRAAPERIEVRRAEVEDAAEMARLAAELGYPMPPGEMTRRLANLLPNANHHIAVVATGDRLAGWVHVEHRSSLDGGERAELMGLVVDPAGRRRGFGRELVGLAERWALAQGLSMLTVRSNTIRELAHPFYESLGFARTKTQHVYAKALVPIEASDRTRGE
jgi:GNAT superfamily N-acetyltransferase